MIDQAWGVALAAALAIAAAVMVDRVTAYRGLDPPGFRDPLRRLLAGACLGLIFYLGIFAPATSFGEAPEVDFEALGAGQIFVFPILLLAAVAAWLVLGFGGAHRPAAEPEARRPAVDWAGLVGLRARRIGGELAIGLVMGCAAWLAVLVAALVLGLALSGLGGEETLAQEPPPLIVWMASLPVATRLLISLSAGVVEEIFFRGFLQPRIGVLLSSALFVGAHLGYGQPIMLFGIALLSLIYAGLARWRGSVYAAMTAHFFFDAVQLLVVIPQVLSAWEKGAFDLVAWGARIC